LIIWQFVSNSNGNVCMWQVPADGRYGCCYDYYKSSQQKVRFTKLTSVLLIIEVIKR